MPPINARLPEWAQELWEPCRYKFVKGGRGSAKSRSIASALVIQAAQTEHRVLCAREVQRSIRDSSKRMIDDEINRLGLRGSVYESTDNEVRNLVNGSLFMFGGLRGGAASIRSMEGITRFWGDEAQAISLASINTVTPTIRAPGSEIWMSWNPLNITDPVDVMAKEMEGDPDALHVTANYDRNPWFPPELRRDMERDQRRDPDKHAHIWLGQYQANSEARVFRNWEVADFITPDDAIFRFGADWGFASDPTVLVRCFLGRWQDGEAVADIKGTVLFIDAEAYQRGCGIDDTPALFAGSDPSETPRWRNPLLYPGIAGARFWPIVADSARPELVDYMVKRGFRIEPAIKGPGSVEDGVEFLKSYDIAVHPRCSHVIEELRLYSYKVDPLTGRVLPILEDRNNHCIDAVRYLTEAIRKLGTGIFDSASAGRRETLGVTERDSGGGFGDNAAVDEGFGFGSASDRSRGLAF